MYDSDMLDEYCEEQYGHTDWSMDWDEQGNLIVTFYKEARQCYLDEMAEEEEENE